MATLEQRRQDGDQARLVLENEAFGRAFDAIKQEYMEAWERAPARDVEGREEIWKTIKLLGKLRSTLEAAMQDGTLAKVELEHQERRLAEERRQGLNVPGMT